MAEKLETIQVQFQKRNARKRGATSSDEFNDMIDEVAHDLAESNDQWNNRLVPLVDGLPDGSEGLLASAVDAFTNGIDGKNVFADQAASTSVNSQYFNTSAERPNTIWEQLDNVYTTITLTAEDLENQINNNILTAAQISVADDAALYAASNVEEALAETMNRANTALSTASAIDTTVFTDALKSTTGDPGSPSEGQLTINTFDNAIKIYADGAWRTLTTW